MSRVSLMGFAIAVHLCVCSCKKDRLQWNSVEKLTSHTNSRLNRILLLPNGYGVIGGGGKFSSSEILVTTDGGLTWEQQSIPQAGKGLYGLGASPAGKIYLTGFDGKMLSSSWTDFEWKFTQISTWRYYVDVAFPGEERGYLISTVTDRAGTIDMVDSAGSILSEQSFNFALNDIEMLSPSTGFIAAYGVILKTVDGGLQWNMLNVKNDNFTAVHAYGEDEAWTCGYNGSIFHTTDGGNNWQRMRNGNDLKLPSYHLLDILFTDPLHGYAVGENGVLIYTDDGGHHWMEFDRFTGEALRSIAVMKEGKLLVCGDNGSLYKLSPLGFE